MEYKKTQEDARREASDLRNNPIMRFMKHQDYFKFNVGDILIKQRKSYYGHHGTESDRWETECTTVKSPKKFMYVFENELGIGYLKQLRVDGSGFTSTLICTVNFDPDSTRFMLDPEYVDHILIGGSESFQYNQDYLVKKKFREDAIAKNNKILVNTRSVIKTLAWFNNLKVGQEFWWGDTFDDLMDSKYNIVDIVGTPLSSMPSHVYDRLAISGTKHLQGKYRTIKVKVLKHKNLHYLGQNQVLTADWFLHRKITHIEPFPMKDELCGPQK